MNITIKCIDCGIKENAFTHFGRKKVTAECYGKKDFEAICLDCKHKRIQKAKRNMNEVSKSRFEKTGLAIIKASKKREEIAEQKKAKKAG